MSKEIWGHLVTTWYVRQSPLTKMWIAQPHSPWVSGRPISRSASGYRTWKRAVAEADYQARLHRWNTVARKASMHMCGSCAGDMLQRESCPENIHQAWLREHPTQPQPPEYYEEDL